MRKVLVALLLIIPTISQAKVTVLEVDTGVDISHLEIRNHVNIKDWETEAYIDTVGHGTHIAGIILDHVCDEVELISCKFYEPFETNETKHMTKTIECFKKALNQHIDIINYSAGGLETSPDEYTILKQISNKGIKIVVAAGNDNQDLNTYNYYPAKYDLQNIIVVGNLDTNGERHKTSNYGLKGMVWEIGTKVWSTLPYNSWGYMTGSSQATGKRTNFLLRQMCKDLK